MKIKNAAYKDTEILRFILLAKIWMSDVKKTTTKYAAFTKLLRTSLNHRSLLGTVETRWPCDVLLCNITLLLWQLSMNRQHVAKFFYSEHFIVRSDGI